MKLTNKQQTDLVSIEYFIPNQLRKIKITDEDRIKFLEYSEKGLHKQDILPPQQAKDFDGFNVLVQGKRWRGIHMEMYEQGILDGSMPYFVILGGCDDVKPPREVVEFMKKEMFQGKDADIIEKVYQEV